MSTRAHILILIATVVTTGFILRLLRRGQLRSKYALLWIITGLLILPFAVFPAILTTISRWAGVSYPPAMFLLLGTGFLLIVVVHFSWELSRLETRTRMLAEELALLRAEVESGRRSVEESRSPV
jgi:hypothetical protein